MATDFSALILNTDIVETVIRLKRSHEIFADLIFKHSGCYSPTLKSLLIKADLKRKAFLYYLFFKIQMKDEYSGFIFTT